MNKLFSFLTLRTFAISHKRKRVFAITLFILAVLLILNSLDIYLLESIPYAKEVLAIFILTLITNILASTLRLFFVSRHRKKRGITGEDKDNFTVGANALVAAVTGLAAIVFFFLVFQIEFKSFLTSIALFAVALTMIFQDFIKNFLQGLSLMFSVDYEIGDYIQVGSMPKGIIRDISFASTHLRTDEGNMLFVPNVTMRSQEVVNFSKIKFKRITTEFAVLRAQIKSLESFENALLEEIFNEFSDLIEPDKIQLLIKQTTKEEIVFRLETSALKYSFRLEDKINKAAQTFAYQYNEA